MERHNATQFHDSHLIHQLKKRENPENGTSSRFFLAPLMKEEWQLPARVPLRKWFSSDDGILLGETDPICSHYRLLNSGSIHKGECRVIQGFSFNNFTCDIKVDWPQHVQLLTWILSMLLRVYPIVLYIIMELRSWRFKKCALIWSGCHGNDIGPLIA